MDFDLSEILDQWRRDMTFTDIPSYFLPPPLRLGGASAEAEFEQLYLDGCVSTDGQIVYASSATKWEFLDYICRTKDVLVHGSGNPSIKEFETRKSNDVVEFGDRNAVYASSDAIWAMFFAILNRKVSRSLVNSCIYLYRGSERKGPLYYFSINDDAFLGEPWQVGTIYVLPKTSFERQKISDREGFQLQSEQWASPVPVTPIVKLAVSPSDFPFLSSVCAHNLPILEERCAKNPNGFPWRD